MLEPLQKENQEKHGLQWHLSRTWSSAYCGVRPDRPDTPREDWDYGNTPDGEAMKFKTPDHASELIKKVAHTFGATLVRITKLNPDWEYAIAVTTPAQVGPNGY